MKEYKITYFDGKPTEEQIAALPKAEITEYPWGDAYCPECGGVLWVEGGEKICVRMYCREESPKATKQNFCDMVCRDSCMEWFFQPVQNEYYVNCEMNSIGTSYMAVGTTERPRTTLEKVITPPKVKAERIGDCWTVTTGYTADEIRKMFDMPEFDLAEGRDIYFNMYKCGDETEVEHYGSWAPIKWDHPNFHLVQFFGKGTVAR